MGEDEKPNTADVPEPAVQEAHVGHEARPESSRIARLKSWYVGHKLWAIPASILLFVLVLIGIPATRYGIAGQVVKKSLNVKVLDATTGTPVSGAVVSAGGIGVQTNGSGLAKIPKQKVGNHSISITKKYYTTRQVSALVPIFGNKTGPQIPIKATGRQVKITVTNLINKKPLSNVDIAVADITAKTDKNGTATIVLPASSAQQSATLRLDGYINAKVIVKLGNNQIQQNDFRLTPTGKIYFLSKLTGKVDVVKTNLDGTDRETILAGTGNEQDQNTVLLASRDWKYLALLSRRAGSSPTLYMINTSDDSLTAMDQGSLDFNLSGWVGDSFVYTATDNSLQLWQSNRQIVKSYNAQTKKNTTLDQTTASGSGPSNYLTQLVGDVYAYDDQVYYVMNWASSISGQSAVDINNKQATFNSIKPDGSAKKAIKSFGHAAGTIAIDVSINTRVEKPNLIDIQFSDGSKDNFYSFTNGQVKDDSSLTSDSFYTNNYPTYLESPSGDQSFWSESRDGKNTLLLGGEDGGNGKQIATLSDYNTYGWFTDDYLLVSKNSSELYIMAASGKPSTVKISDYHKPALTFYGYGGGYGGL